MKLYPLKFEPILKSVIWGGSEICKFKSIKQEQDQIGESWEISAVENNVSIVANGSLKNKNLQELISEYKGELVGKKVYDTFNNTFPLLIKFIDARDDLSIQVHPNDKLAKERHNSFGKTEMWYVINASDNSKLYSGFSKQITPDEYIKTIENDNFIETLQQHKVNSGDVFFLPAGRVHAIGAGCFVAEIQQTSNITYRIYDYNRKDINGNTRELHTELAKNAIDYKIYDSYKQSYDKKINQPVKIVSCEYFKTNFLELNNTICRDFNNLDSFVIYICMKGKCSIKDNYNNTEHIHQGESILIPANINKIDIIPDKDTMLLETFIDK